MSMIYSAPIPQGPSIAGLVRDGGSYTLPNVQGPWVYVFVTQAGHWRISKVYVPSDMRCRGYGQQLLTAVCRAADDAGVTVTLTVEPERGGMRKRALLAWYRRMGFVSVSVDQNHMERPATVKA